MHRAFVSLLTRASIYGPLSLLRILVYRTPSCNSHNSSHLFKAISDFSVSDYPCVLLGDFNFPDFVLNAGLQSHSKVSQDFLDLTTCHDFEQLVNSPCRGSSWLDLIFCNLPSTVRDVNVSSSIGSSDHASVTFSIDLTILPETVRC